MIKSLISLVAVAFCLFVAYQYIEDKRYKEWNEWANKLQKEKDAWQEPIDRNCRKAVRSISDTNTLRFSQDYISDYDLKRLRRGMLTEFRPLMQQQTKISFHSRATQTMLEMSLTW